MTRRVTKDIAASVHARLKIKAKESNHLFDELLHHFVLERFLYRLSKTQHADKFVLKGGLMLRMWKAPLSRPTRDIDLLGSMDNSLEAIRVVVEEACLQEVEPDGLTFDAGQIKARRIAEDADYRGVRVRFQGYLAKAKIEMQLDIGFGDVVVPSAERVDYPTILNFPPARLFGYTKESTVAEKFEAMIQLGSINSRMKDFYDIWLLSRQFDFDGALLARAIQETFSNRGTEIPLRPLAFEDSFTELADKKTQWRGFLKTKVPNLPVPGELKDVVAQIQLFLGPVSESLASREEFKGTWKAPGPWHTLPPKGS